MKGRGIKVKPEILFCLVKLSRWNDNVEEDTKTQILRGIRNLTKSFS